MLPSSLTVILMIAFRRSVIQAVTYSDIDAIISEFVKIRDGDGSIRPSPSKPPFAAGPEQNVGQPRCPPSRESLGTLAADDHIICTNDAADVVPSGRLDDTPCSSLDGPWLSVSLDTVFRITVTDTIGRLDLQAVGSDWTGTAEALFGAEGPLIAYISQTDTDTGAVATFVGHCRVVDGMDSIIGTYTRANNFETFRL